MADHDCIAYSNTVEIFFTQQDQLQTVMSSHHDYISIVVHYYSRYPDQSTGSCISNKSGPQVVLRTYYCIAYTIFVEICFAL